MHDALAMRIGERLRHVAQHADDFSGAERPAPEPGAQRLAVDEGHRVERQPIGVAG